MTDSIIKNTNRTTLDVIDLPNTVYKYRCWDDPFHQMIIKNREVYMAAPSSFEDPLDCKFPIRYDLLTDEEILNFYLTISQKKNNHFNPQQHLEWSMDWYNKTQMRNPREIERFHDKFFHEYDEKAGILCLTTNPISNEMWEKYSCNHQGFIIGFNARIMFEYVGGGGSVSYVPDIPIIFPSPKHSFDEQRSLHIFHKLKKWSFEEEYRTTIFHYEPLTEERRKIKLPVDAFKEIILGRDMTPKNIQEILNLVSAELNHIEIRKVQNNGSIISFV